MRIEAIIVVITEWVACIAWLLCISKTTTRHYKFLAIYLLIIASTELMNLLFSKSHTDIFNIVIVHFNVPLEILFWIYFLLATTKSRLNQLFFLFFSVIYLFVFILDRTHIITKPLYFDSWSYGIGNLLLLVSVVLAMMNYFKSKEVLIFTQSSFFWIVLGLLVYYGGSFPYQNFRNFLWGNKMYFEKAYFLHYLSQAFNCIMYLLFAYATKWKPQ